MKAIVNKLLDKLKSPVSWRMILWAFTLIGINFDPAIAEYIVGFGIAGAMLIEAILIKNDKKMAELPPIELISKPSNELSDSEIGKIYTLKDGRKLQIVPADSIETSADNNGGWSNK